MAGASIGFLEPEIAKARAISHAFEKHSVLKESVMIAEVKVTSLLTPAELVTVKVSLTECSFPSPPSKIPTSASFLAGPNRSISVMNFPLKWETAGVPTGSKPGVLSICGEQEFLADLKRKGYTCEMLIPPNQIQRLAFFAVFCVAWFNADGRLGDRNERQDFGERYPKPEKP